MAKVTPAAPVPPAVEGGVDGAPTTFTMMTTTGSQIVCGKPTGVQKLALRRILTSDQLKDNELSEIAKAFLAIQTFDGYKPILMNCEHFEALMTRFGSDADVDEFMGGWQKLNHPDIFEALQTAYKDGVAKGLYGEKLEAFVAEALQGEATKRLEAVKH